MGRTLPDANDASTACNTHFSSRAYYIPKCLADMEIGDNIYDYQTGLNTPYTNGKWIALSISSSLKVAFQVSNTGYIHNVYMCS
jgi:hypothetical protein